MAVFVVVFNLIWAYWLYFHSKKVKNQWVRSLVLGMGCGNFACAVILGLTIL
tara:strand:- start:402 stop:557 length:156 start_codon:yes stop_codon:yes gene_type:complete